MGINRNIVECKLLPYGRLSKLLVVLIETLWNVNQIYKVYIKAEGEPY